VASSKTFVVRTCSRPDGSCRLIGRTYLGVRGPVGGRSVDDTGADSPHDLARRGFSLSQSRPHRVIRRNERFE
jgi:hypothetical protein